MGRLTLCCAEVSSALLGSSFFIVLVFLLCFFSYIVLWNLNYSQVLKGNEFMLFQPPTLTALIIQTNERIQKYKWKCPCVPFILKNNSHINIHTTSLDLALIINLIKSFNTIIFFSHLLPLVFFRLVVSCNFVRIFSLSFVNIYEGSLSPHGPLAPVPEDEGAEATKPENLRWLQTQWK